MKGLCFGITESAFTDKRGQRRLRCLQSLPGLHAAFLTVLAKGRAVPQCYKSCLLPLNLPDLFLSCARVCRCPSAVTCCSPLLGVCWQCTTRSFQTDCFS